MFGFVDGFDISGEFLVGFLVGFFSRKESAVIVA